MQANKEVIQIANHFQTQGLITQASMHGSGNINDTYLVISDEGISYILQRVNTDIFTTPEHVMQNMRIVTQHIQQHIHRQKLLWKTQHVILTTDGEDHYSTEEGSFWRMISFIKESKSFDIIDSHHRAFQLGKALGLFHALMDDLPKERINSIIEGFHIAPNYLMQYEEACLSGSTSGGTLEDVAHRLIEKHKASISLLEDAKSAGTLPLRIIHGDPKINNIMFDLKSDHAISMIDLDTVQLGLLHYDIGDCARSSCNPLGEEERERWREVQFDTEGFKYLWRGYLSRTHHLFSEAEYDAIYDALFILTFETGLRFFTDYLNGDIYFKTHYPQNNLYRGLVQLVLAESIHKQRDPLQKIISEEQERITGKTTVRS